MSEHTPDTSHIQRDLIMWDNSGTLHRALPCEGASKELPHQTMVPGKEPIS